MSSHERFGWVFDQSVVLACAICLSMTGRAAAAFDFAWSATADTLDWFGIDNPDAGIVFTSTLA